MATIDPMPYRPWRDRGHVVDGSFRWKLGARPLDLDDWIELGPDADEWIADKARIMADHPATAFAAVDDSLAECDEIATAIRDHLHRRWPDRHGASELDPSLHPLDAAARLVPEDLVVMTERDGRLIVGAGSVCFPNRWDLVSKLGASMSEVHAPVARLNHQLEQAVDGFLDRLEPERSFWRLGWGILDTSAGYTPPDPPAARRTHSPGFDDLHVRVERETLRRFPRTRAVLFTIRTYITPLRSVIADDTDAESIARILAAMPADVRRYKDLTSEVVAVTTGRRAR